MRRMSFFRSLLDPVPRPLRLLDVGGSRWFWSQWGFNEPGLEIVLLNADPDEPGATVGDARALPFPDKSFDVVFSNSVIEHVGLLPDQMRMASEIRRVGKRYFVQ